MSDTEGGEATALQTRMEQLHELVLQSRKERERDREIMEALLSAVVGREAKESEQLLSPSRPGRERVLDEA